MDMVYDYDIEQPRYNDYNHRVCGNKAITLIGKLGRTMGIFLACFKTLN